MQKMKATAIIGILLASIFIALLPIPGVSATSLTSITPTSGPVGTSVRLIGTIDITGGAYQIWYYPNGSNTSAGGQKNVVSGTASAGSLAVDKTFKILSSVVGSMNVTVVDMITGTKSTTTFTVVTSYKVNMAAKPTLENTTATLNTIVHGGVAGVSYTLRANVTNPKGVTKSGSTTPTVTNSTGSFTAVKPIVYPTNFTGANTNYVGNYTLTLDKTAPGKELNLPLASGSDSSFSVILTGDVTNKGVNTFRRYETVYIRAGGYDGVATVAVNIKDSLGASVSGYPKTSVAVVSGVVTDSWGPLSTTQTLGVYTVSITSSLIKTPADTSTFTVKGALLTTVITAQPAASYTRTSVAAMKFKSTYPDGKVFNYTLLGSVTVSILVNTTTVVQTTLTAANYDVITGQWTAQWTIPKSATAGKNYNFTIAADKILDFSQNSGPNAKLASTMFEVTKAALLPTIVAQPATYYNRTGTAVLKVQLSYPDLTAMAAGDLGTINATLVTPFGNKVVKLTAADFTAPSWTINWKVPSNATVASGYYFNLVAAQIKDAWDNAPTTDVASNTFDVTKVVLAVPVISTDKARYAIGEIVTGFFTPVYLDGSPVTKGTGLSYVELTRADGTKQTLDATYSTTAGRWEAKFTVGHPVGIYTLKVKKNTVNDYVAVFNTDNNLGPAADVSTTLEVYELVTLSDVLTKVNALATQVTTLQTALTTVSGDVSGLKTSVATLNTAVTNLQTALTALSNTAAKQSDLVAVNSAVSTLSASLSTLQSAVSSLSSTAAAKTDVQAVNQALSAAQADLDALTSNLASVSSSVSDNQATTNSALSTINTYVLVAIILALIAAVGSILSIVLVYRKIAA